MTTRARANTQVLGVTPEPKRHKFSYLILSFPIEVFTNTVTTLSNPKFSWDDQNQELIILSQNQVHGFSVYSHKTENTHKFSYTLDTNKYGNNVEVLYARRSPSKQMLALLASPRQLVFCRGKDEYEYNTKHNILGFIWLSDSHVLVVHTQGIDLYKVSPTNNTIRLEKGIILNVKFFKYHAQSRLLMCYGDQPKQQSYQLFSFKITENTILKLKPIELRLSMSDPAPIESEVVIITMYGAVYAAHLWTDGQEIHLYRLGKDGFARERIMNLFSQGRFAISVVDSLLFVHNYETKLTMAYDIRTKQDTPVCPPIPIAPYQPYNAPESEEKAEEPEQVDLYSNDWEFVTPNLILDKKGGYLFELQMTLNELQINIRKKAELVKFLMRRLNSKFVLLQTVKSIIASGDPLSNITSLFNLLNTYYKLCLEKRAQAAAQNAAPSYASSTTSLLRRSMSAVTSLLDSSTPTVALSPTPAPYSPSQTPAPSASAPQSPPPSLLLHPHSPGSQSPIPQEDEEDIRIVTQLGYPVIEQIDMSTVFSQLEEEKFSTTKLTSVLMEYIRSLNYHGIHVQQFVQKTLIDLLVKKQNYPLLHQCVQYKVISDNKPTALQILSIEEEYKPAYQIAMDMLSRIQAYDSICEILLSKKEVSHALQIMFKYYSYVRIPPRVIFEVVDTMKDPIMFFNTYEMVRKLNTKYYGKPDLDEECEIYEQKYREMFSPKKREEQL